ADRSFTVTLFLSRGGDPGFDALRDADSQRAFMEQEFADAVPLLTRLEQDFRDNPVGILGTVRCRQWHLGGRGLLIGDAAHAVVPFHGQGMNAAFEDCVALADALEDRERDWQSIFRQVEAERRPNANAIADMALENYWIMRDAVRDPRFLVRKALEHELERRHPGRFVGRYSLVMFHRIPYAEAQRRGEVQADILDALMQDADTLEQVDMAEAARLIAARLEPIEEPPPSACPG
ncbi:MAG: FAD-dependent monooxygenase, partial [Xanthomonadales bacterium]|nr:FAD-dependent monooxygenase [Xanthomonadales bacterium]